MARSAAVWHPTVPQTSATSEKLVEICRIKNKETLNDLFNATNRLEEIA